jgi:hypothetical protein
MVTCDQKDESGMRAGLSRPFPYHGRPGHVCFMLVFVARKAGYLSLRSNGTGETPVIRKCWNAYQNRRTATGASDFIRR